MFQLSWAPFFASEASSEDKENVGTVNQGVPSRQEKSRQEKSRPEEAEDAERQQLETARREAERRQQEEMRQEAGRRQDEALRLVAARLEEQRLEIERLKQESLDLERLEQEHLEIERQRKAALVMQEQERTAAEQQKRNERAAREAQERQAGRDAVALKKFLQEHKYSGANAKRKDMRGYKYPLHTAVKLQDTNMIGVLLAARADRTLKNSSGETPFDLASRLFKGDEQACALLQQALQGQSSNRQVTVTF